MTGSLARPHAPGPNLVQRLERVRAYLALVRQPKRMNI
jgi:hypothetical protein